MKESSYVAPETVVLQMNLSGVICSSGYDESGLPTTTVPNGSSNDHSNNWGY